MVMPEAENSKLNLWYKDGLRFKCTGCGKCCTGAPGHVWINDKEIEEMADFLQISKSEFLKRYVRVVGKKYSLIEDKKNYDCVFLKDNKCQVYKARPTQCRTFPWWPENLESPTSWKEASAHCEGIEHLEAPVVSLDTIIEQLDLNW